MPSAHTALRAAIHDALAADTALTSAQAGRAVIVGVVSWSTGPNNTDGCGGLTGVTPLTLYREWILRTARGWGVGM
jgi:hypothetical protein